MQGEKTETCQAVARRDLAAAELSAAELALLEYTRLLTENSYRATAADVQRLREAGWTDPQIAEAVYTIALFAFFNRVADAFGLTGEAFAP